MCVKYALKCAGAALILCLQAQLAHAHDVAVHSVRERALEQYTGSTDADALLRDPRVQGPLRELLGPALPYLLDNLEVRGAVDLVAGQLSLSGNAAHRGGIEEAVLCVTLSSGAVSAAIFSQGRVTIYAADPDYLAQGLCIKDWITLVNSGHYDRLRKPDNVRIKSRGDIACPGIAPAARNPEE